MTSAPFAGFKQSRRGFGSSQTGQGFLEQYLQFFNQQQKPAGDTQATSAQATSEPAPAATPAAPEAPAAQRTPAFPGDLGDIGLGTTAEGKTILDPYGSYAGFMPKIEQRDGQFYVEDNRGYGPFKGKMHKVSPAMAKMQARKASMGMTRYLMPNPDLAKTYTSGSVTVNTIPMGPSSYQSQLSINAPTSLADYNKAASEIYQQRTGQPFGGYTPDTNLSAGIAPTLDSSRPFSAFKAGMPIDLQGYASFIQARTGMDPAKALQRAKNQIGGMFYREGVKKGYYEPGTYMRVGSRYNIV